MQKVPWSRAGAVRHSRKRWYTRSVSLLQNVTAGYKNCGPTTTTTKNGQCFFHFHNQVAIYIYVYIYSVHTYIYIIYNSLPRFAGRVRCIVVAMSVFLFVVVKMRAPRMPPTPTPVRAWLVVRHEQCLRGLHNGGFLRGLAHTMCGRWCRACDGTIVLHSVAQACSVAKKHSPPPARLQRFSPADVPTSCRHAQSVPPL